MFSHDFCKWLWVQGLYQNCAAGMAQFRQILGRKEFAENGLLVLLRPPDLADIAYDGKSFEFPNFKAPPPPQEKRIVTLR